MQLCYAEQFNDKAGIVYKSKLIVLPHVKQQFSVFSSTSIIYLSPTFFQSIFRAVTGCIFLFLRSVCLTHIIVTTAKIQFIWKLCQWKYTVATLWSSVTAEW